MITNMYGDMDEDFYYSIESMFSDFARLINTFDGSDYFDRNKRVVFFVFHDCCGDHVE